MNTGQRPDAPGRSLPLPVPVIDHVIVNARERLPQAAECYRRLGFTLTPQGRHTLGSINHLAVLGADYIELLGAPPEGAPRTDVMAHPEGLTGIAFATEDAGQVHAALDAAGLKVLPPLAFSRPVDLSEGRREAAFRTVPLAPGTLAAGRVFFCQHLTRGLVWRDEWRRHPNGALGIARVVITAAVPEVVGRLFTRLFGPAQVVADPADGVSLRAGLASIDVLTPAAARARYGELVPEMTGREAVMSVLVLRASGRERITAALAAAGLRGTAEIGGRLVVPVAEAFGVALAFETG